MQAFRIRCSAIGKLMAGEIGLTDKQEQRLVYFNNKRSNGKTLTALQKQEESEYLEKKDNPELPQTAKTYLIAWKKEQLYKRKKEFTSKYTDKGNIVESDAIEYAAEQLNIGFAVKNEKHFTNEFLQGTPDVVLANEIWDTKSSWDCFGFPLFEKDVPNKDYWWQGQGYMALTGRTKYKLIYCLMDMPEEILLSEARRAFRFSTEPDITFDDIYEEMERKHRYSGLPDNLRFKYFSFSFDFDAIKRVEKRVKMARAFLETLTVDSDNKLSSSKAA